MSEQESYPLNDGACRYMAESMGMTQPYDDQEQNFILGHMVTFAFDLYEAAKAFMQHFNDCDMTHEQCEVWDDMARALAKTEGREAKS